MSTKMWKFKQYDWVFSVPLSVGITVSNLKNEDMAKSDSYCDFYSFLIEGVQTSQYFYERGASSKKGWEPMVQISGSQSFFYIPPLQTQTL